MANVELLLAKIKSVVADIAVTKGAVAKVAVAKVAVAKVAVAKSAVMETAVVAEEERGDTRQLEAGGGLGLGFGDESGSGRRNGGRELHDRDVHGLDGVHGREHIG